MNFYIGNKLNEIKANSKDAYFTAEFGEYLYQIRNSIDVDLEWLFNIDPYETVFVEANIVPAIIQACRKLIELEIWRQYEFPEDGETAVKELLSLSEEALICKKGLISNGD